MTKPFKPMLAATCENIETLKFPLLASPKLDGIRAIKIDGVLVSRNLKPIQNAYVQAVTRSLPDGFDGELIVGSTVGADVNGKDVWARSQSGVMSTTGRPDFTYHVFDWYKPNEPDATFNTRYDWLCDYIASQNLSYTLYVRHSRAKDTQQLRDIVEHHTKVGFEGTMVRSVRGAYKFGRSTVKEGGLLKIKAWHDAEAIVVDFVEQMRNDNEATVDALGRTKRSTAKAGKSGKDTLGALVCTLPGTGKEPIITVFELGTGFDDATRKEIWENRKRYDRRLVTFKYQNLTPDGVPRFPVFKGFRDTRDIGA